MRKLNYKDNRRIITKLIQDNQGTKKLFYGLKPVYDGVKNLYATRRLWKGAEERRIEVLIEEEGQLRAYTVNLKLVGAVDLSAVNHDYWTMPQEVTQLLDIIIRHGPNGNRIPVGNSVFVDEELLRRESLGNGRELAYGIYLSARNTASGPNLVVDCSVTAFYKGGPLLNFVCELLCKEKNKPMDQILMRLKQDYSRRAVVRELKNLQVTVTHLPYKRKFRISGLTRLPADKLKFEVDGQMVTLRDYFSSKYQKQLRFPHLPCVEVNGGKSFLPMEVCELVPNQVVRKLTDAQTSEVIKYACKKPTDRFASIEASVVDLGNDSAPYTEEFGIQISSTPLVVDARVLDAPSIAYRTHQVEPKDGAWNVNTPLHQVNHLDSNWVLINFTENDRCNGLDDDAQDKFITNLTLAAKELGIVIGQPPVQARVTNDYHGKIAGFYDRAQAACKGNLKMLVCIVSKSENDLYNEIKRVGDVEKGIASQCIDYNNAATKTSSNFYKNIVMKINTKLGGINNVIGNSTPKPPVLLNGKAMMIGADVTHATNYQAPMSVASLVGSYDRDCTKYHAVVRVQPKKKQEIISDFKLMAVELLEKYQLENNELPQQIVYYRDGISEGQFKYCLHYEVQQLAKACETFSSTYAPKITTVVVQKRHHTRFRPSDLRDGVGKPRNIPAGTVVDTSVVHPVDFDFFLCSHVAIQGTSRPTHYYVIFDQNNFGADDLQKMTYYLCCVYAKCARSISIPAPVMYAHLAAYRARVHVATSASSETGSNNSYESAGEYIRPRQLDEYNKKVKVAVGAKNFMYFC